MKITGASDCQGLPFSFILEGLGFKTEYEIANSERLAADETPS